MKPKLLWLSLTLLLIILVIVCIKDTEGRRRGRPRRGWRSCRSSGRRQCASQRARRQRRPPQPRRSGHPRSHLRAPPSERKKRRPTTTTTTTISTTTIRPPKSTTTLRSKTKQSEGGFERPFRAHFQAVADGFATAWMTDFQFTNVSVGGNGDSYTIHTSDGESIRVNPNRVKCPKLADTPPTCASTYARHECWTPGRPDADCPGNSLCCFNGCDNVCFQGIGTSSSGSSVRKKKDSSNSYPTATSATPVGNSYNAVNTAGSCPNVRRKRRSSCRNSRPNCWSAGTHDLDCPNSGLCCFDGCNNRCVDDEPLDNYESPLGEQATNSYQEPTVNNYQEPAVNNYQEPAVNNYQEPTANNYQGPTGNSYQNDQETYESPNYESNQEDSYSFFNLPNSYDAATTTEVPAFNAIPDYFAPSSDFTSPPEVSSQYLPAPVTNQDSFKGREPTLVLHIFGPPNTLASISAPQGVLQQGQEGGGGYESNNRKRHVQRTPPRRHEVEKRCPVMGHKSSQECLYARAECQRPNVVDQLCPRGQMCCFDGCTYKCGSTFEDPPKVPQAIPNIVRRIDEGPAADEGCPRVDYALPRSQCRLSFRHECSLAGQHTNECHNGGLCCFNGCANYCHRQQPYTFSRRSNNPTSSSSFPALIHGALARHFFGM